MFNHHPACVFGLRCTGCNFAETIQIEIEGLVIALPFQVDAQGAWRNVFVQAHNERCILESFICVWCRLFWLFYLGALLSGSRLCALMHPDTLT